MTPVIAKNVMMATSIVMPASKREEIISHSPVKLVDEVILRAYSEKASDIHIEPGEHDCRVRIRIDGELVYLGRYKKEIHEEAVARLKVLSLLRTDIRMSPQDGRFKVNIAGIVLNVRISVVPSFYGEKCVLRLLPPISQTHTLEALGFCIRDRESIDKVLSASFGMILVVGPTGSGKTTTLYSMLQKTAQPGVSAVTLEDPVEYAIPNITQIPIHSGSSMNFSTVLRAVVRQDPDVIMVGEIRDAVTAELSTHIALTGHLLLSTLHTNDSATALPRLIDMGVEPFLVASTMKAVVSQRLVRKVCQKCVSDRNITDSEIAYLKKHGLYERYPLKKVMKNNGCSACRNSGYFGRTVIVEVLELGDCVRDLIMRKASANEIKKLAMEGGMTSLLEDAIEKVSHGITTLDEVAITCQQ